MIKFADDLVATGQRSSDQTVRHFSAFAAQYRRAYASALQNYIPADYFLSMVAACKAVGGGYSISRVLGLFRTVGGLFDDIAAAGQHTTTATWW